MFLEINNKKHVYALILATFFLLNCSLILAEDLKDKPIYVSKPTYIKSEETNFNQSDKTSPEHQYILLKDSSVYRLNIDSNKLDPRFQDNDNNFLREIKNNKNIVGKYLFAYSQAEASKLLGLNLARPSVEKNVLGPQPKLINNFRVILDKNERVYFTDGSLLIKFNTNVNFSEFASVNNLMLKKEYIDLNMGVYVHNNFNTLENKIESLQEISSISDIQYNIINPHILPE